MIHRTDSSFTGLVGVAPKTPIGVAVTVGVKGKSGAPTMKDRFWLMSPTPGSREFSGGDRTYTGLARDPHPAFGAWNNQAKQSEVGATGQRGPGRVGTLRGMIVHADLAHAARWNRSAQKLPEPHANPPSMRPACEGNGIKALRFKKIQDGEEIFEEMACPNEACPFAMKRLCKPSAHLIFMLRWNKDDPWEANFPSLLAMYSTRSWNTLRNLMGLFELVLGTEAVAPWEEPETWQTGLAAELGIQNPSLVGLPFVMTVSEKTKAQAKTRFPVVSFSPDGDLGAWLVHQRQQRELAAGAGRLSLPAAPAAMVDPEVRSLAYAAAAEIDPASNGPLQDRAAPLPEGHADLMGPARRHAEDVVDAEMVDEEPRPICPPPPPPPPIPGPQLLSPEKAAKLLQLAEQRGVSIDSLEAEAMRLAGTAKLSSVPAVHETALMGFIERRATRRK